MNRVEREKEFHNRIHSKEIRNSKVGKFYSINSSIQSDYNQYIIDLGNNNKILDYGCGKGSWSFNHAKKRTNEIFGIDISEKAIEIATKKAVEINTKSNLEFKVMNAENLTFEDNKFDLIAGQAILHHLNLQKALGTITKKLKPNGKAIFIEPLGGNPLINLYRKLTPQIRSDDEQPFRIKELKIFNTYFKNVNIKHYYFSAIIASLFYNKSNFSKILNFFERIDRFLFRIPLFRAMAWQVLIQAENPIK